MQKWYDYEAALALEQAELGIIPRAAAQEIASKANAADVDLEPKDGRELPATDLERVKPGIQAPDFTLEDQNGRAITLSSFQTHTPVVLVFYRGHW